MIKQKHNQGFTLIELIIYIAIVGLILTSISYLYIELIAGQERFGARLEVNQSLRTIVGQFERDARAAQTITSVGAGAVEFLIDGQPVRYFFNDATGDIERQVGSETPVELNSSSILVTGNFIDRSYQNRSETITMALTVQDTKPDEFLALDLSISTTSTVQLRGRR